MSHPAPESRPAPESEAAVPPGRRGTGGPRSAAGSVLGDAAVVLGAFLAAGLVAGVLWPHLVHPVHVTRTSAGIVTGELDLSHRIDNDGWYSVLAAVGGLVLGVVLSLWRRTNEVVTVLLVTAGAFLAAWVSAVVGRALGPDDPRKALAHAAVGATAPDRVTVSAHAAYLVWPIAAVAGAVLVLWRPFAPRPSEDGGASTVATDGPQGSERT
jgi:hypothetical protein